MSHADILAAAHRTACADRGVSITYTRGADECDLTAVKGRTEYPAEDEAGLITTFVSVDFLVAAADLVLDDAAIVPQKGDRITCDGKTYEVLPINGAQCYGADPTGTRLRIHTKQVGAS